MELSLFLCPGVSTLIMMKLASNRDLRLTVQVDNGKVAAGVDHALSHNQAKAARTASDDAGVAIEREGSKRGLANATTVTADRLTARQLIVLGILDCNIGVGSRVLARVRLLSDVGAAADGSRLLLLFGASGCNASLSCRGGRLRGFAADLGVSRDGTNGPRQSGAKGTEHFECLRA